jgi:hypothetical protein
MDGDNLVIGHSNKGTNRTSLVKDGNIGTAGLQVESVVGAGLRGVAKSGKSSGVEGESNQGVGVTGLSRTGIGVRGITDYSRIAVLFGSSSVPPKPHAGVFGAASSQHGSSGVYGTGFDGVRGVSSDTTSTGVRGAGVNGTGFYGVVGTATEANGSGVIGVGAGHYGVIGTSIGNGVYGHAHSLGYSGVLGYSQRGIGVFGRIDGNTGTAAVMGESDFGNGIGVYGLTQSPTGYGGRFRSVNPGGIACWFDGRVAVAGDLFVTGIKSAAVRHGDGSHRLVYAMESPESWFEDFGRGRLVRGRARIKLDRAFAGIVRTRDYHVFLTPEGDSQGLYVSRQSGAGFEVREQQKGTSTLRFSYRIVARRRDIDGRRLAMVKLTPPPNRTRIHRPSEADRRRLRKR